MQIDHQTVIMLNGEMTILIFYIFQANPLKLLYRESVTFTEAFTQNDLIPGENTLLMDIL